MTLSPASISNAIQILTLVLVVNLVFLFDLSSAQEQPEFFLPKEHTSKDGQSKITLIFVSLDGDYLTVVTPKGKEVETSLKHFSKESQAWFKTAEKFRKKYVQRIEAFEKKIKYLKGPPARRKVFYRSLAEYSDVSWIAEKTLLELAADREEDLEERFTAICAFGTVARVTDGHGSILLRIVTNSNLSLHQAIESNPELFVPLLSRFGEKSEDYLIHVACTGELVPPLAKESEDKDAEKKTDDKKDKQDENVLDRFSLATRPVILATTEGPRNRIRAAAILGLGGLSGSKKVPNLLTTLLRMAQTKINGQKDLQSTKAILLAVGKLGQAPTSLKNRFKTLEKTLPSEVKFAEAGIKAAAERRKAQQQLDRLKKKVNPNRIFKDVTGREIVFGKFLNFVDEFALFTNHKNEMIRVEKSSLSKSDLNWINANIKAANDKAAKEEAAKEKAAKGGSK